MKILHLINDHQVIERKLLMFEQVFPESNEVLVFSESQEYKHLVKYRQSVAINSSNLHEIANKYDFSCIDYIVVHFMSFVKIDFLRLIPNDIPVCWSIYGFDLYDQFADVLNLKVYYRSPYKYLNRGFLKLIFPSVFDYALYIKTKDKHLLKRDRKKDLDFIMNRVEALSGMPCDKHILELKYKRSYLSMPGGSYPLEETLGELYGKPFARGNEIMLGNSASWSNNHLYALKFLKEYGVPSDCKIRLTLSYGGNKKYREVVESSFEKSFAGQIIAIKDYMQLSEYNKSFMCLRLMIMPAWRQESVGTMIMGFYFGIKVIMSTHSPLYGTFKSAGFVLFSLEESTKETFYIPLSEEEKKRNRNLAENFYSLSKLESGIRDFFTERLSLS